MTAVDRFTVRWRLAGPQWRSDAQAVLDALFGGPLDSALDGALESCPVGLGADELVAVAMIEVPPQRIALGQSPTAQAQAWAAAVATAVDATIAAGGPGVVRYPNRAAAVLDVALRCAAGDPGRVWAWRQLGLWPTTLVAARVRPVGAGWSGSSLNTVSASLGVSPDTAPDSTRDSAGVADSAALEAVLGSEPAHLPAVLATVARRGLLGPLVAVLGSERLERLAGLAWRELGGSWPPVLGPPVLGRHTVYLADVDAVAQKNVQTSVLGSLAVAAAEPGVQVALAALAVMHLEPVAVAAGRADSLVVALLGAASPLRSPTSPEPTPTAPGFPNSTSELSRTPLTTLLSSSGTQEQGAHRTVGDDHLGEVSRRRDPTANAGLLFLLNLLDASTGRLAGASEDGLASAGVRWTLYRLGDELVRRSTRQRHPACAHDPALLAFCGMPPGTAAPQPLTAPPDTTDHLLAARADAVLVALRARLAGRALVRDDSTALLATVLHRRGEVVVDPGWIEVELDLDEVSVDLRAAGLDLDPGWLPALGCVVRFRYV